MKYILLFFVGIIGLSCGDKKQPVFDGTMKIKNYEGAQKVFGIYIPDPFKSNLKYMNAASRDTLGNWNIIDSKKALEALWQFYLQQNQNP